MTKPVSIQQRIRILDAQDVSWRETARRLGVSRDTVRKYATMEDRSPETRGQEGTTFPDRRAFGDGRLVAVRGQAHAP